MEEVVTVKNTYEQKNRVTTLLSDEQKEALQELAWDSGRSMSSYIRYLIIQVLNNYNKYDDEF